MALVLTRARILAEKGEGLRAGVVVDPLLLVVKEAAAVGAVCHHGWMRERVLLEQGAVGPPDSGIRWVNSSNFPLHVSFLLQLSVAVLVHAVGRGSDLLEADPKREPVPVQEVLDRGEVVGILHDGQRGVVVLAGELGRFVAHRRAFVLHSWLIIRGY